MSNCRKLSRREFLKMVGATASAAAMVTCTPQTSTEVAPTATAESALEKIEPIVPEMVLVEAGSFQMGSTNGGSDEQPVHTVHITRPFYIAKYAMTFEEYDLFCDDTIGIPRPKDRGWGRGAYPVSGVNWYDAVKYCNWLSEKEGLSPCYEVKGKLTQYDFSANGYRLPTEAEWEYAARGGQKSQGYEYAGSDNVDDVGWYEGNSGRQTHPVGQKQPNELGLYDMSGNMWEWCWDWYGEDYYASSPASDPTGPSSGTGVYIADADRARRGGSYREKAVYLRVAFRGADGATYRGDSTFRLVRTK
jgi:formylglycine-generating enzyme required for sulfatase activity